MFNIIASRRLPIAVSAAVVAMALATVAPAGASSSLRTQTLSQHTSPDGRTVTSGALRLTAGSVAALDPDGHTLAVHGSGFDTTRGIYLALCVIPATGEAPSPCGGGIDTSGQAGASRWISSNPPSYATGLTIPYGPGGSFTTSLTVQAGVSPGVDCRAVRCAITTRSDHTRSSDRTQDLFLAVSFSAAVPPTSQPAVGPTAITPARPAPNAATPTTPTTLAPVLTTSPTSTPSTTTTTTATTATTTTTTARTGLAPRPTAKTRSDAARDDTPWWPVLIVGAAALGVGALVVARRLRGTRR